MHWSVYALLSAVFAALVAVFGKLGLKNIDTTLATTVRAIVMALLLVVVSFSFGKFTHLRTLSDRAIALIVVSGVAGALSWLFYFYALKRGTASGVAAVDRTSVVFTLVLALLFLGEKLTWHKAIGAVLVALGAALMAF